MRIAGEQPIRVVQVRDGVQIDLRLLDALLRLRLAARREGWTLRVHDPPDELRALARLVGVSELLGLESRRKPELREQLGVQEVVQPDDPVA